MLRSLAYGTSSANGYYSPFTYFTAKVLFDVLPLRVVPPFILGAIIYKPVGLVPTVAEFWKFILVLILFNLVASSVVFFLGIVISDTGVANLVGSLVMLFKCVSPAHQKARSSRQIFSLLFAGLFVNRDKLPYGTKWIQQISFFHAAYEALLVNEVRYLQLIDHRYGVDIEVISLSPVRSVSRLNTLLQVPAASILSMFGFYAQAFWWPDVPVLVLSFVLFIVLSFAALVLVVRERR